MSHEWHLPAIPGSTTQNYEAKKQVERWMAAGRSGRIIQNGQQSWWVEPQGDPTTSSAGAYCMDTSECIFFWRTQEGAVRVLGRSEGCSRPYLRTLRTQVQRVLLDLSKEYRIISQHIRNMREPVWHSWT